MLDITSKSAIEKAIETHQPNIIINTAAYTAVDAAENNQEDAYLLNEEAVRFLAEVCAEQSIGLIHISTDYVFDGASKLPYTEIFEPNPQTVYGQSKLAGEKAIQSFETLTYAIIRTSWLYSNYGHNFYKTMVRLGSERAEVSVVDDQHGIPTLANDLAIAILKVTSVLTYRRKGIYHYSNEGVATWYAFAKAIFEFLTIGVKVIPVSSKAFPTIARRPQNSVLDCSKIETVFNVKRPFWRDALEHLIK